MKSHKKAAIITLVLLFVGLCVFWLGVTEWNNLCAPKINWSPEAVREIFSGWIPVVGEYHWYLAEGAWYNMVFWLIGIGMAIAIASGYLFWYLWED